MSYNYIFLKILFEDISLQKKNCRHQNAAVLCALLFHPDQPFAFSPLAAGSLSYAGFLARDSSLQAPSHRFDNGIFPCLSSHTVVGPHRLRTGFPLSLFLWNWNIRRF